MNRIDGDREYQDDSFCIHPENEESNYLLSIVADGMGGIFGWQDSQ